jgi:hypothetical protein
VSDFGYVHRICPNCRRDTPTSAVTSSKRRAEDLEFDELKNIYGRLGERVYFSYVRCNECGLLFASTFFNEEQLKSLHHSMPDNTRGVSLNPLLKTQASYLKMLRQYSPLEGDYLELGPDLGLLAGLVAKQGHFKRFWMFEPNTAVHGSIRSYLASHEHRVITDMFSLDAVPDGTVSAGIAVHVLDHLSDPRSTLEGLAAKVKSGGIVLFVTHDESSLMARAAGWRWAPYAMEHPQLFRAASITKTLKTAGFETLVVKKTVNHYPFDFLASTALWMFGFANVRLPSFLNFSLPIRLGNILTIARRR